ncbi:serine hydrolase domain-containing protein [Lentzea sp. NBRC 105346]|uniref:serine hydrolase domain-containing protein n=1 Tax=Lentzea sp. NBRC 105346 TaxID=3032205 RepID=UPI003332A41B
MARGSSVEVQVSGEAERDTVFRIASITKPIVAAAVMLLVDDGVLRLDDPIGRWLPELAAPKVVRTPGSDVDDVVPARRPITVFDVLTSRAGWGFPADFSLPAVQLLFAELEQYGLAPQQLPAPGEWLARLSRIPLLHQPGETWLYNICSNIQGVLVARASGMSLPEFLETRIFRPLRMKDTGFSSDRLLPAYHANGEVLDPPDGQWSRMPAFPSGAGGLVSTADDWLAFGRMLLDQGAGLLSPESVRLMTTDHLTEQQRRDGALFLDGQGWGFGGTVDVAAIDPWNVPGRYGWVGGTGTSAHIVPSTNTVAILLTQTATEDPVPPQWMRDFWLQSTIFQESASI